MHLAIALSFVLFHLRKHSSFPVSHVTLFQSLRLIDWVKNLVHKIVLIKLFVEGFANDKIDQST